MSSAVIVTSNGTVGRGTGVAETTEKNPGRGGVSCGPPDTVGTDDGVLTWVVVPPSGSVVSSGRVVGT